MRSKDEIRKEITEHRKSLDLRIVETKSKIIADKILQMEEYIGAKYIYIYMDFNGEVSTKDIILHSFQCGKKVAIPKIVNGEMNFYYISDINETREGYFGIREPVTREIAREKGLMIMPGVAFDEKKHRIGYGKGFYDKYLDKKELYKIGLAFDFQVFNKIPYNEYDIGLDRIVTEERII